MRGKLANIGRKAGGVARRLPDNRGVPLAMGGIFAAGVVASSARSVLDLGNEAAFGDQDADRYFLGERGLSPGTVFDSKFGSGFTAGASLAAGGIGAVAGATVGIGGARALANASLKKDINIPKNFADDLPLIGGKKVPLIGGEKLFSAGKMSSGKGKAIIGGLGLIGGMIGAGIGGSAPVASHVNRNADFFKANPYSRGSAMQASSTGAYGDIVLGMHNSRRG